MSTPYESLCSNSTMNREGFISNFCPYEVAEGVQFIKLEMFGNTEYNLMMFLNIKSFSATFCVKKKSTR